MDYLCLPRTVPAHLGSPQLIYHHNSPGMQGHFFITLKGKVQVGFLTGCRYLNTCREFLLQGGISGQHGQNRGAVSRCFQDQYPSPFWKDGWGLEHILGKERLGEWGVEESQDHWVWKRPSRSSSPTCDQRPEHRVSHPGVPWAPPRDGAAPSEPRTTWWEFSQCFFLNIC